MKFFAVVGIFHQQQSLRLGALFKCELMNTKSEKYGWFWKCVFLKTGHGSAESVE
jgi:hypothetical protein